MSQGKIGCSSIAGICVGALILYASMCGGNDGGAQEGALESAKRKVTEGRASHLTPEEADALGTYNRTKSEANRADIEKRAKDARSQFSAKEIAIYEFMNSRWTELSETPSGYNPDLHDKMVAQEAAKKFGVTESAAGEIYLKVDLAGLKLK